MATFSDWLEEKIKEEEQKNKGPSMSFSNWTNKEKAQGTLKSSVDFNAPARGPLFSGTSAVSPAPATSSTLAKSNTDLQLEGLKANAIEQSDGNVWDEETLRLNRLQNERAKLLSYMTNAQKNQYNAKEQNARDAYIDSIRNDLNKKQGEDYAKEILNEKDKGNKASL